MKKASAALTAILMALVMVMTGCNREQVAETEATGSAVSTPEAAEDWPTRIAQADEQNKSEIIESINNGIANDFGYTIDSEEEKDALRFYDIYVTDKSVNREKNYGFDMVVRYSCEFDDQFEFDDHEDDNCQFMRYYSFSEETGTLFKDFYADCIEDVKAFLDYLYENRESITLADYSLFNNAFDEENDEQIEGCIKRFTAADFEAFLNGSEQ